MSCVNSHTAVVLGSNMKPRTVILTLLGLLTLLAHTSEAFYNPFFASPSGAAAVTALGSLRSMTGQRRSMELYSSTLTDPSAEVLEIKKWFFLNYRKRSEVFEMKGVSSYPELVAQIWRSILISIRVLEKDEDMKEYVTVSSFPSMGASPETVVSVTALVEDMVNRIDASAPLFQDSFARSIKALVGPDDKLIVSIETTRTKSRMVDYDDVDEYVPSPPEMLNNDIPDFPFPTVYDFISEINRPQNPTSSFDLRFNFKVKDLKYDVEKMKKKKKNPQELVDSINVKLTRLANWRDILSKDDETMPDPFAESAAWGERIKLKYQSLKALSADPKKALDTQYDKRKTFVKIIDQWSDRLKRSFKYVYQSQREFEDFATPILRSKWRNEIVNITKLFSHVAFLDMKGPDFQVGAPAPLFDPERYFLWESDYPAAVAMYEMLTWFKDLAFLNSEEGASISQHTYSRGFITERVIADFWLGMSRWMASGGISSALSAEAMLEKLDVKPSAFPGANGDEDHTETFVRALQDLNDYSRASSRSEAKPVKEMYRDWFFEGKELVDWWTTLIRDMDLVEEVTVECQDRQRPWSEIMAETVYNELEDETKVSDDPGQKTYSEKSLSQWRRLQPIIQEAEKIEQLLPWRVIRADSSFMDMQTYLGEVWKDLEINFDNETVHVDLSRGDVDKNGFLFVAPRFFRGIGLDEELSAFLEFCGIVEAQLTSVSKLMRSEFTMKIMHPQLMDENEIPQFRSRAPHPSILITTTPK